MDIRKDFQSAEPLLHRLAGIGAEFAKLNREEWPHLKNQEDFEQIYRLPPDQWNDLEELYAKGRDCAYFMSGRLTEFNDVGRFPTFASYVDSLAGTWAYQQQSLEAFLARIKRLVGSLERPPWALGRMISVFENQLRLLDAVRHTASLLKQTHAYLVDKGEAPVDKPPSISIGQVTGRVNIHSTDNSTNISIDSISIFGELAAAITASSIEPTEKKQLLERIDGMKLAHGTPSFTQKYKEFIQNAANHMGVLAPFLSGLTDLLK